MANGSVTSSGNPTKWETLSKLDGMQEWEVKRVLRSRREIGLPGNQDEDIDLWEKLDQELEQLSLIELQVQGSTNQAEVAKEISEIAPFASLMPKSPAFVQYVNSRLFFQVRFAAEHLKKKMTTTPANDEKHFFNERPAALPTPPPCEENAIKTIPDGLLKFQGLARTPGGKFAPMFRVDQIKHDEVEEFELWLRGLHRGEPDFPSAASDLYQWAADRTDFYVGLEKKLGRTDLPDLRREWKEGIWKITNPFTARCALVDLYWLATILRADVSPRGMVTYKSDRSWLYYLPIVLKTNPAAPTQGDAGKDGPMKDRPTKEGAVTRDKILWIEEILRSVFDFACELLQNAVEIAEYTVESGAHTALDKPKRDEFPDPGWTRDWRSAFDQELGEIGCQRRERHYEIKTEKDRECPEDIATGSTKQGSDGRAGKYWSQRITTGRQEENLVGLAFSGGGIRSATFGLGILQSLRDFRLLHQVDYLSTVSGGGYIGAWLLGNVRRTRYWLSRETSWEESIGHLRRYSKYLAPESGLLSADTWVIWGTWFRNAFLIQLTTVAWLAGLFAGTMVLKGIFEYSGSQWTLFTELLLAAVFIALAAIIVRDFAKSSVRPNEHRWAIGLTWFGSVLGADLFWAKVNSPAYQTGEHYSAILVQSVLDLHYQILLAFLFLGLLLIAKFSYPKNTFRPLVTAVSMLSLAVIHLALCGVLLIFRLWSACDYKETGWYAYIFGPPLVLLSVSLGIVILIGLLGKAANDWKREWWTRFGSWLAIYGTACMALNLAAIFGPVWLEELFTSATGIHWGKISSAIASAIVAAYGSVKAGKSSQTKGDGQGSSKILEWVAVIGAIAVIISGVLIVSSLFRFTMVKAWMDASLGNWWDNLNYLLTHSFIQGSGDSSLAVLLVTPATLTLVVLSFCGMIFSWRFDLNTFGLNQFYRNRLVRCYLGATRWQPGWRKPQGFTGFDDGDDIPLTDLRFNADHGDLNFRGPFPIVNCSLNLGGSADLAVHTRQSASFTLTPLSAGADRRQIEYAPMIVKKDNTTPGAPNNMHPTPGTPARPQLAPGFAEGPTLGQAISISGAAVNPNMGYSTSPLVAVLLTMFNARLGWWFPNPGKRKWKQDSPVFSLAYLIWEFLGLADETANFVNVSDGGHFENLGIYELVRRRARVIIASDGECDSELTFGSLGNVIRICETDFGAKIDIDVTSLRRQAKTNNSVAHCAVGKITYCNGSQGYLIYLKASITGDENADIQQYLSAHPDFPHQSTANQFFTEDQFESYRRLGRHIADVTFSAATSEDNLVALAGKLRDLWVPAGFTASDFVSHTTTLDRIWERFRTSPKLARLFEELLADAPVGIIPVPLTPPIDPKEKTACLELFQLMENVFIDLRLDDFWDHPDNRGWAMLFCMWAKSPVFRSVWNDTRRTFGIRFEYFCKKRLSLEIDEPVFRIERH